MSYLKHFEYMVVFLMLLSCHHQNNTTKEAPNTKKSEVTSLWLTFNGIVDKPIIVLVSGDEEYRSEEALPQLAKILSKRHGFNCSVLFAQNPEEPGIVNPNYLHNIPGLELLEKADLMVIFTRFRALPDTQMQHIDKYLKQGKPVIGIRTSTHAFYYKGQDIISNYRHYGNSFEGNDHWDGGFGRLVLGEKWISHHGGHKSQSTKGVIVPESRDHPILNGINDGDVWGPSDVYGVRLPLPGDSRPLVYGQVTNREGEYDENDPLFGMRPTDSIPAMPEKRNSLDGKERVVDLNNPMMPIAWVKSYQIPGGEKGKAFTSTIGSSTDLLAEGTRRLIVNAVYWCLDIEVPIQTNVDLVGEYVPTQFQFHADSVWQRKDLKISSLK